MQVLDSIPTGLGALHIHCPLYIRYHPQNEEKCKRISQGIIFKGKNKKVLTNHNGGEFMLKEFIN